jgi:hypothetical protein
LSLLSYEVRNADVPNECKNVIVELFEYNYLTELTKMRLKSAFSLGGNGFDDGMMQKVSTFFYQKNQLLLNQFFNDHWKTYRYFV